MSVMIAYLVRRVLAGIVLVWVVATLTFAMMSITGGNAARTVAGQLATRQQVARESAVLGLNHPWVVQYADWLGRAVRGDFGQSWFTGNSVSASVGQKLPVTLSIVIVGLLMAAAGSIAIGIAAAVFRGWLDRLVQVLAIIGFAIPSFLVGLAIAVIFAVNLHWFPATGYVPVTVSASGWIKSIVLPSVALAVGAVAATAQQVRGSMIDVLSQDYVRTLRSRGLSERRVLFKHALRNAAPPALTVLSLQFIGLVGGAVIIEQVFGLPGIGSAAVDASIQGDRPLVMGVVVSMVLIVVGVNLLMDLAYGWLNPKVRVR
jgi:peptide/nickel transport system permease protein